MNLKSGDDVYYYVYLLTNTRKVVLLMLLATLKIDLMHRSDGSRDVPTEN